MGELILTEEKSNEDEDPKTLQKLFSDLDNTKIKMLICGITIFILTILLLQFRTWLFQHIIVLFLAYLIIALTLSLDSRYPFGAAVILLIYCIILIIRKSTVLLTLVAIYGLYFLIIGLILDLKVVLYEKLDIINETITGVFEKTEKPEKKETKKTRIILIASGKGGVGKTTIAANLAIAMSKLGINIAVMDLDIAMPDLEIITGIKNPPTGLIDVLENNLDIRKAMYIGHEGVKVIPSGLALEGFTDKNVKRVKSVIKNMPYNIEVLILDMPPGVEARKVMGPGMEVLLVTTPETPSVLVALNMKIVAEKTGTKIIGIIVNRMKNENGELEKKEIEETIESNILVEISEDENVKEAQNLEIPIIVKYPDSKISKDFIKLAKSIGGARFVKKETVISSLFNKFLKRET